MTNRLRVAYILQWLIGALTTVAFTGGSAWLSHIENEVDKLSISNIAQVAQVARLEANFSLTEKRLDRIEQKLDLLLEMKKEK